MFSGSDQHTLDDKGRVAIPARFREVLRTELRDERLVVTQFRRRDRPCLEVYPKAGWERFAQELEQNSRKSDEATAFREWYVNSVRHVEVDPQGRILIPPGLREYARFGRDVMVAGLNLKFRIWNLELFRQVNDENEREVFQNPTFLRDLGL